MQKTTEALTKLNAKEVKPGKQVQHNDTVNKKTLQLQKQQGQLAAEVEKQTKRVVNKRKTDEDLPRVSKRHKTTQLPEISGATFLAIIDRVSRLFFIVPKQLRWLGVVTTDGIVANWHCAKPGQQPLEEYDESTPKPICKTKVLEARCIELLSPTHYGQFPEMQSSLLHPKM